MRQNVIEFRNYIKSLEDEHKATKLVARMSSKNPNYDLWKTGAAQWRYDEQRSTLHQANIIYYFVKHPLKTEFYGGKQWGMKQRDDYMKRCENIYGKYYDKPVEE